MYLALVKNVSFEFLLDGVQKVVAHKVYYRNHTQGLFGALLNEGAKIYVSRKVARAMRQLKSFKKC